MTDPKQPDTTDTETADDATSPNSVPEEVAETPDSNTKAGSESPDQSAEPPTRPAAPKNSKKDRTPDRSGQAPKVLLAETKMMLSKLGKKIRRHPDDKLIMVPIDFSGPSAEALAFAARLADNLSAPLLVLHVVHDPGEMPGYYAKLVKKKRVERIQDIARDVFLEFLKKSIEDNPKLKSLRKATHLMVMGLPVTRILQLSEKFDPFLVVMGSQGRTGLKHLFLGSKAEQVVQLCQVPVTIVKQERKPSKHKG